MDAFLELLGDNEQLTPCIRLDSIDVLESCPFQIEFDFWKEKKLKGTRSKEYGGFLNWRMLCLGEKVMVTDGTSVVGRNDPTLHTFFSKHFYKERK